MNPRNPNRPEPEEESTPADSNGSHFRLKLATVAASIVLISFAHYHTGLHLHRLHALYDRLYYLPIFAAALWFGLKGGLGASLGSSLLYAPHILFQWRLMPAQAPERYLEILLFNVVGGLTGILAQRASRQRELYRKASEELERAYQELKGTSSRLLLLEQRLRKAEKHFALGELSATVTHEFMNPLGSIKGAAEILRDEFPPGHEKHAFLEILTNEADRLERTARNILRFGSQVHLLVVRCNPNALIETVLLLAREEARKHGVEIRTELSESVQMVPLDEDKIQQVLLNLVTNAIQAMTTGGIVTIRSAWTHAAPRPALEGQNRKGAAISVSDTGTGIAEEEVSRIFDAFYTTKPDGTGLGLAIVKRILDAHGGTVTVESSPGRGSTFTIWLPARDKAQ
jgi:signal transduction histidine kinase